MEKYTFVVEKPCPICMKSTRVVKTRSRLVVEKRDEDLCTHYKGFNPYFYKIWICEHCGFAADEKTFLTKMPKIYRQKLWEYLSNKQLDIEFTEERNLPDAVASYQLALKYLEIIDGSLSKRATLNLNLAWLYRAKKEAEKEKEYMTKAAELFDESISKERYPVDGLSDTGALYLVGAIYYRLGDFEKCAQHLSRIIGDQTVRSREPKVYDRARDLWGEVRAIQKKQEEEKNKKNAPAKSKGRGFF